jgi:hypothetical protein
MEKALRMAGYVTCYRSPHCYSALWAILTVASPSVRTKLTTYPNLPHYFWIFPDLQATAKFVSDVIDGVKWTISQSAIKG